MHKELISERFSSGSIFQTEQGAIYSVLTCSMMLCEKATQADRVNGYVFVQVGVGDKTGGKL